MQRLLVLQSLWAMQLDASNGVEKTLEENVELIVEAGFDGISMSFEDEARARRAAALLAGTGLVFEAQLYPQTIPALQPGLDLCAAIGVHHVAVQADMRPRRLPEAVSILEQWRRMAEETGLPVFIETHRNQLTNDLHFTLDLIDSCPDLRLLGDLSHYVVAREWPHADSEEHELLMRRVLDNCWAFHGRVASSEQIQIPMGFAHSCPWLERFMRWWAYGFQSWRKRSSPGDTLSFTCELGPWPYAILGPHGTELSDRWAEAMFLKKTVRELWEKPALTV